MNKKITIVTAQTFNRGLATDTVYALKTWAADEDSIIDIKISDSGTSDRIEVTVQGDYKEALSELINFISSEYEIIGSYEE